ncbi:hypothetical protein EGI16_05210 [Chryseobacterium sp. G0240]|uniref:hypothetical protein n=1 Tax=Chryseobacterium sp. G0240 TaxID=2487066 RepID=UPI000F458E81|nr:hypothetical protein [Chryseobacterium sp. G0240]ROI05781.1 hypothetical protein EGI16_05210 [Chryseobacterium sp. G0240]
MYSIVEKINIGKKALISQTDFTNEETVPSAKTSFICCQCNHENTIEIVPYQSGFPIFQLYHGDQVITKNDLLKNGAVTQTSATMQHFGELTVNNLPTLYFGTSCKTCTSKYICVFGYGEKQPGLTILTISGIWEYKESE